jgi:hypothetical protein
MGWPTDAIPSWEDMQKWVDDKTNSRKTFLFRGQASEYGNLKPKLLRMLLAAGLDDDYEEVTRLEVELRDHFVRQASLHLDEAPVRTLGLPMATVLHQWGIMQHYGAPTRLLDWTGSPYVALYFAVGNFPEHEGEVWCYAQDGLENWHRTAMEQQRLSGPPVEMELNAYQQPWTIDDTPILHHFIFGTQTSRMAAQQGVFTVCTDVFRDHAELLEQILQGNGEFCRALIPRNLKVDFLKHLHFMNITGASLFPGIDGVGRWVDERARIALSKLTRRTRQKGAG